jgi:hypothetical protein
MKCCASTHDSTSYIVSDLSQAIQDGKLPIWAHLVLDEAYPCTEQELSPHKRVKINEIWKDSFNYHLSLQRQCIERAFGILVSRWGIFWRSLKIDFELIPLVIRVCVKLHNICIDAISTTNNIAVVPNDMKDGDRSIAIFTDGTGMYAGRRGDIIDNTSTRDKITSHFQAINVLRPVNSRRERKLRRIANSL